MNTDHGRSRIIWLEADRFDTKANKSPWIEMSKVLNMNGYDVTLVTGYEKAPYYNKEVNVVSLAAWDAPLIFRLALLTKMIKWVRRYADKDDVIILKPESLLIAPFLKMSGYENLHLDIRTLPLRALDSFKARLDHLIFWDFTIGMLRNHITGYSFITERLKAAIEKEFKTTFSNYVVWQSSVNMSVFKPVDCDRHGSTTDVFTLFYHGNIYATRGLDKVIEAISLLSPAYKDRIRLVVVGPDKGEISLQDLADKYGVAGKVIPVGAVPYEDIPERIAEADCCICPLPDLQEWNVSSPLKVFEYMACEKPIILTPIPAHKDVAGNVDFVVWTEGYGAEDMRKAIEYSIDHRESLKNAARLARSYIKDKYTWDAQGAYFANYLNRIYRMKHR